jgi:hypothetical protein
VALVTLVVVALILWVYPSSTDFAASNPYWNGLQILGRQWGVRAVSSPDAMARMAGGTALIAIPYVRPSPRDLEVLSRYVTGGGMLILLDDFGFGNEVLAHLGSGARFAGQVLTDPLFNYRAGRFPKIIDFPEAPAQEGVERLILNHATAISGTEGLTVLARSAPTSFLDTDRDGRRDPDEASGPFVVAAVGRLGAGYLVLVSDPSILLNGMLGFEQNRRFVQDLFGLAGERLRIYIYAPLLPRAPLDVAKDGLARLRGFLAAPPVALAAIALALAYPMFALGRSSRR